MERPALSKLFLLFLVAAVLYVCYLIFKPFLVVILVATILTSVFYTPFEQLSKFFRGKRNIAALVMCVLVALLVILPVVNFIVYTAQRSGSAYQTTITYISEKNLGEKINFGFNDDINVLGLNGDTIRKAAIDFANKANQWIVSGAGSFIKGTTNFVISFIFIFFTMYFFFIDGEKMLGKLMYWTPLPNKYDKEIFRKFRVVSKSIMGSTFITAGAQGIIGAIGFMIVGLPAFFAGIGMAFLSLLPYVGAALVWAPAGIYLLVIGKIWQGIFLLAWGAGVVSMVDNFLRAYLIKDIAQVHPLFIIFSILGGIALFGFWGVIFGPLIISLTVTILHIYELEYEKVLER